MPWVMIPSSDCPDDFKASPADNAYELFACHIDAWDEQGRFPRGHITGRFGAVGNVDAETAALLHVRDALLGGV